MARYGKKTIWLQLVEGNFVIVESFLILFRNEIKLHIVFFGFRASYTLSALEIPL